MDLRTVVVVTVHLALFVIACRLVVIDIRTHRLPNRIVLPTLAALVVVGGVDAMITGDSTAMIRAAWGMLILGGFYAALRLLSREGMGGGDVKLAAVIGLILGWHSWQALAVGAASAFVLGALFAVSLMMLRRANGSTRIAFGPWMILGALLGIVMR
ncbi:prepilin peptidase [Microbacterium foliorum]|uniref:Prepilin peptidase n=1 Tax=Microbacterium foliorum TaxID=104336 RepID=A0A4Y5YRY8_9MICO|nr:A24 family peptidase [Microbacterium foliorum]QDE35266.1 prepilin peptidase [Microbacterium foliorum]